MVCSETICRVTPSVAKVRTGICFAGISETNQLVSLIAVKGREVKICYRSPPRNPGGPLASAASRRPKGAGPPGFRGGPQCSIEKAVYKLQFSGIVQPVFQPFFPICGRFGALFDLYR